MTISLHGGHVLTLFLYVASARPDSTTFAYEKYYHPLGAERILCVLFKKRYDSNAIAFFVLSREVTTLWEV